MMKEKFFLPLGEKAPEITPKTYISRSELKKLVAKELKGKLEKDYDLYMSDSMYYCPPLKDAKKIIEGGKTKGLMGMVIEERFDCDDLALLMKAHFAREVYLDPDKLIEVCRSRASRAGAVRRKISRARLLQTLS